MSKQFISRGFSLIEVLLVIALLGVLAGLSMPVYQQLQARNDVDVAVNTFVGLLRSAQVRSQGMEGDSSWGVYATTSSMTLFRGDSYDSRNPVYDEVFFIPSIITPSGTTTVQFSKHTGYVGGHGTTTLTSTNNDQRTITITPKGVVSY